jgi:putative membrane protein
VGALLVRFIPALKRLFAGEGLMARRVSQRAAQAFIAEEVFNTRDRTGILIFLSLLEHKVLVVGDAGINAKVESREWVDIVGRIVAGIRGGRPAEGLIDAIQQSGVLLQKQGVALRGDDTDELRDSLRMGDDPQP